MNPDPNMSQEDQAAFQEAMQAQQQAQQNQQGFSVGMVINSLEERLKQETFMLAQCNSNIENLNKIIPALKAIP